MGKHRHGNTKRRIMVIAVVVMLLLPAACWKGKKKGGQGVMVMPSLRPTVTQEATRENNDVGESADDDLASAPSATVTEDESEKARKDNDSERPVFD